MADFLIAETLRDKLLEGEHSFAALGRVSLRGKNGDVMIFAVTVPTP